ncbi:MAG: hypothetical protein ABIB47_04430 [Candidatus Woesearchaeota archaeon]
MKKGLIVFLLIGTFLVSGCSNTLVTQGCHKDSCDPLFASCDLRDGPLECSEIERVGQVCGRLYDCEMGGVHCVVKKSERYDECVECFNNALERREIDLCNRMFSEI